MCTQAQHHNVGKHTSRVCLLFPCSVWHLLTSVSDWHSQEVKPNCLFLKVPLGDNLVLINLTPAAPRVSLLTKSSQVVSLGKVHNEKNLLSSSCQIPMMGPMIGENVSEDSQSNRHHTNLAASPLTQSPVVGARCEVSTHPKCDQCDTDGVCIGLFLLKSRTISFFFNIQHQVFTTAPVCEADHLLPVCLQLDPPLLCHPHILLYGCWRPWHDSHRSSGWIIKDSEHNPVLSGRHRTCSEDTCKQTSGSRELARQM